MEHVREPGGATVTAASYVLRLRDGDPTVELADCAGRTWSRLSLLASLDRVDGADESFDLAEPRMTESSTDAGPVVDIELSSASTVWDAKTVRLRCYDDHLELTVQVDGAGPLGDVHLLGGRAVLASGACGRFWSSTGFASVFVPAPTEPVQVVRPASVAATVGIVGDASPGRLHGIFSPPPLALVLGREAPAAATEVPSGDWLSVGVVAAVPELRFTELRYEPLDGGFGLTLDYDGHTTVDGTFSTPMLVLRPVADPWSALERHRTDLVERGLAPAGPIAPPAAWWREPIFCGWGAQCAEAAVADGRVRAPDLARQDRYDSWLTRLAEHDIVPGTVVIDDRWQAAYGSAEPDLERWPDLRAWIAGRHAAGQRVLLWWKAWDPEGLPGDECVLTPAGTPVAVDPGNPAYLEHLARIVTGLLGPDGLDADGFKIDFTQRAPAGRGLRRPGATAEAPWGIAALHALLATIYRAAKAAKPDALVVTHTPHPGFADVSDMIRLNDVLDRDPAGVVVPAVDQLGFRHAVVAATMPGHLIDTDQWPIADRAAWRAYAGEQVRLGVPALYYAERIDGSREELTPDDYALVASTWRQYRTAP